MTKRISQVVIFRQDLRKNKAQIASDIANVSMKFLTENNEAERDDQLLVKLSETEVVWLSESCPRKIMGAESEDRMSDLLLRAQLFGIEAHFISEETERDGKIITCLALGPDTQQALDEVI